eukprot:scaffold5336_cov97-Isochrysis_galbana.AAC.1
MGNRRWHEDGHGHRGGLHRHGQGADSPHGIPRPRRPQSVRQVAVRRDDARGGRRAAHARGEEVRQRAAPAGPGEIYI